MVDAKTEHYIDLSIWGRLRDNLTQKLFKWGSRHKTDDLEEWIVYSAPRFQPVRSRRTVYRRQIMFEVGCISLLAEQREDTDTNAPWRMGSEIRQLFEHVDLEVQTIGDLPLTKVGVLNCHEVELKYINEKNIIFGGSGDFAIDQHHVHSVVARVAATFIQEVTP